MNGLERVVKREQWRAEVEAWRASGQTLSAWARQRNISRDALEYWKRRIPVVAATRAQTRTPLTLIPVRPVHVVQPVTLIELVNDTQPNWRIRLAAGFDAASLGVVLDALESRC